MFQEGYNKFYTSYDHEEVFIMDDSNENNLLFTQIFGAQVYNSIPEMKIKEGDIVVDIGAHIGIFSRYAAMNGAKRVIAYEMMPKNFLCLRLNTREDDDVFNCVVYDKNYVKFNLINDILISGFTLHHFFEGGLFEKIDFLKIDIEGKEALLIQSIKNEVYDIINKMSIRAYNLSNEIKPGVISLIKSKGFSNHFNIIVENYPYQFLYFWK